MLKGQSFCREQASSASGKAASGMSSDEKNQVSRLYSKYFTVVMMYVKWCSFKSIFPHLDQF